MRCSTSRVLTLLAAIVSVAISASAASAAVIISQYYEGASFDKSIELYNTGPAAVDLGAGQYNLSHWSNAGRETWKVDGAPTATQALTGSIAPGATFIIEHTQAANPAYVVANESDASQGGVNFNGDDSVALWTGAAYAFANVVDAFGATDALGTFSADKSFVRNSNILTGTNGDFNAADWTEYTVAAVNTAASNATEYLGFHVAVPEPTTVALGLMALALVGAGRRSR